MTEEQLEKEIQEKQQQLHELRYGEIDKLTDCSLL